MDKDRGPFGWPDAPPRNAETLTRLLHRQGLLVQPAPGEP